METLYIIGLKLNSWRATALHSFAPTLIKHLIQLIKVFKITRNFQAGVIWS